MTPCGSCEDAERRCCNRSRTKKQKEREGRLRRPRVEGRRSRRAAARCPPVRSSARDRVELPRIGAGAGGDIWIRRLSSRSSSVFHLSSQKTIWLGRANWVTGHTGSFVVCPK